jgi:hypothetical protein
VCLKILHLIELEPYARGNSYEGGFIGWVENQSLGVISSLLLEDYFMGSRDWVAHHKLITWIIDDLKDYQYFLFIYLLWHFNYLAWLMDMCVYSFSIYGVIIVILFFLVT